MIISLLLIGPFSPYYHITIANTVPFYCELTANKININMLFLLVDMHSVYF